VHNSGNRSSTLTGAYVDVCVCVLFLLIFDLYFFQFLLPELADKGLLITSSPVLNFASIPEVFDLCVLLCVLIQAHVVMDISASTSYFAWSSCTAIDHQ